MVEKSIDDFLEIEKNLEQYLDDRSFNQKIRARYGTYIRKSIRKAE